MAYRVVAGDPRFPVRLAPGDRVYLEDRLVVITHPIVIRSEEEWKEFKRGGTS